MTVTPLTVVTSAHGGHPCSQRSLLQVAATPRSAQMCPTGCWVPGCTMALAQAPGGARVSGTCRDPPSGFLPASQKTQREAPRTSLLRSCLEGKAQRCPHPDPESMERERRAGSDGACFRVKWGRQGRPETSSSEEGGWPSGAPGPWGRPYQAPSGVTLSALTADVLCEGAHA